MVEIIVRDKLKKLIEGKTNFVLIDVREKDELKFGTIPTAINIPLDQIGYGLSKFDKSKKLIFYCRTGSRSKIAAEEAIRLGFKDVNNFQGSIWAWAEIDPNVKRYGLPPL